MKTLAIMLLSLNQLKDSSVYGGLVKVVAFESVDPITPFSKFSL